MKIIKELLKETEVITHRGNLETEISGINYNSKKIKDKNCFMAIKGYNQDGISYLNDAIEKGANSVITESRIADNHENIVWIQVRDDRQAFSRVSAEFYDNPTKEMYVIGVTGTNGKTTIVSLINDILEKESVSAKIGTMGMSCGEVSLTTALTTPEPCDIFKFLTDLRDFDCKNLVMEVSSVGLKLKRVADIKFSQAVFSTFSGDHLDFHGSMNDYFESKLMLFKSLSSDSWAVVNIDDPYSSRIIENLKCHHITYGFSSDAEIRPLDYNFSIKGIQARIKAPDEIIEVNSSLIGRVNLMNILAAIGSASVKGIPMADIITAINNFKAVRGRLDLAYKNEFLVMIDYAHTDDALESLLVSLREIVEKKIILVFGAGGSRDKTKRPRMGNIASKFADIVVVTSDNPRLESPGDIIEDILKGFHRDFTDFVVETDRELAIEKAVNMATRGDLVVIAGKGHEDYQIFKDQVIHFDDYEIVDKVLRGSHA